MQKFFYLLVTTSLLFSSCRSENKEAIRSQVQQIDGEMVNLRIAINHYQAQMGQAEFDAAVGGFATGYGLTSGDLNLAAEGAAASSRSATQYDTASYSLQELGKRYAELKKRRQDLNSRL